MAAPEKRAFEVNPHVTDGEPLCFGIAGPPGSGKTVSALRLADGFSRVRGGKPALIDTEAGRARKYRIDRNPDGFDFDWIPFAPPFKPSFFMDAILRAAQLNPSAIIVDNASDEHEGPGGVLEWHDANVSNMGGNEWAAWNAPKASRRILTAGIQQIKIPIIMTFRARPKTTTKPGSKTPVALGYVPIAGDELLGIMDLMCLLPPKSNGLATWRSDKAGEDFTIKLPYYLAKFIRMGEPLNQDLGEMLALWQEGKIDERGQPIKLIGEKRQRTPDEVVDSYIGKLSAIGKLENGDDDLVNGAAALREFQLEPRTAAFVTGLRTENPALYERVITANQRRARELMPKDDAAAEDDEDLSAPSTAASGDDE